MTKNFIYLLIIALCFSAACTDDEDPIIQNPIEIPEGYSMVWNDEFDQSRIDRSNWTYETGDGTDYGLPAGWGNNELQIYTTDSENSSIEDDGDLSVLTITARADGGSFTSAKLTTNGLHSIHFGRVDVRAKLPEGQGIWPAIWMLGENREEVDWPGCGEIDIAELLGNENDKVYATVHYVNSEKKKGEDQGEFTLSSGAFSDDYHLFTLDWTPEKMQFFVDGMKIHEVAIEDDMKEFLRSFYLILNVAVGGNWPGNPDNTTNFPQTMYVDYVRVFELNGFEPPVVPALDIDEETIGQPIEPNIGDNAVKEGFTDFGNLKVVVYGGGGEPVVDASETAIDGDMSLQFDYPGGSWGGGYIELTETKDLSTYDFVKFSLHMPETLTDAEIKLESKSTNVAIFLKNYSGTDAGNGFVEYSIPLSDFEGLDLTDIKIPFAMWNPVNEGGDFVTATVLIDNLHFSN